MITFETHGLKVGISSQKEWDAHETEAHDFIIERHDDYFCTGAESKELDVELLTTQLKGMHKMDEEWLEKLAADPNFFGDDEEHYRHAFFIAIKQAQMPKEFQPYDHGYRKGVNACMFGLAERENSDPEIVKLKEAAVEKYVADGKAMWERDFANTTTENEIDWDEIHERAMSWPLVMVRQRFAHMFDDE